MTPNLFSRPDLSPEVLRCLIDITTLTLVSPNLSSWPTSPPKKKNKQKTKPTCSVHSLFQFSWWEICSSGRTGWKTWSHRLLCPFPCTSYVIHQELLPAPPSEYSEPILDSVRHSWLPLAHLSAGSSKGYRTGDRHGSRQDQEPRSSVDPQVMALVQAEGVTHMGGVFMFPPLDVWNPQASVHSFSPMTLVTIYMPLSFSSAAPAQTLFWVCCVCVSHWLIYMSTRMSCGHFEFTGPGLISPPPISCHRTFPGFPLLSGEACSPSPGHPLFLRLSEISPLTFPALSLMCPQFSFALDQLELLWWLLKSVFFFPQGGSHRMFFLPRTPLFSILLSSLLSTTPTVYHFPLISP